MGLEIWNKKRLIKISCIAIVSIVSLLFFTSVYSQTQWLSIEKFEINQGRTSEVAIGQNLTAEIVVGSFGAPNNTNATIGINIKYANGTIADSFANQSQIIYRGQNTTIGGFRKLITLGLTGNYILEAFVEYVKNATSNETIYSTQDIKIIDVSPVSLGMAHEDVAADEVATFKQGMSNSGNVGATTTVKVWIIHNRGLDSEYITATEPPTTKIISNNSIDVVDVLWSVPSIFSGCEYTNSSNYTVYSAVGYGSLDVLNGELGGVVDPLNISSIIVGEKCSGGYCESGLGQTEIGPGGTVSGGIRLKNEDLEKSVVVHEVRAWVEDGNGSNILDLSPSDISKNILGKSYTDNIILRSTAGSCTELASNNSKYSYQDFIFTGTIPESIDINQSYKVVFGYDYGVPRNLLIGAPWNGERVYSFNLVGANVTNLSALDEVTYSATQNITSTVKNIGSNTISSSSVYIRIFDGSNNEIKNFTGALTGILPGEERQVNYVLVPYASDFPLGTYIITATATYGSGASTSISKPFNIIYLATLSDSISAGDVAPYENTTISIPIENQGPTNATMQELNITINATTPLTIASLNATIENNSIYYFNTTYYFDPANYTNITNGSYEILLKEAYGGIAYSFDSNATISFLPAGIKSFSVPTIGINATPFIVSAVIKNIANTTVPIDLNLSANGTTLNLTSLNLSANSETQVDLNIMLNQTGTNEIVLRANYTGLSQEISRSKEINIYAIGADLEVASITYSPTQVNPGGNVTITVNVSNSGALNATDIVLELLTNGTAIGNKTISISGNSYNTTTFSWVPSSEGDYNITAIVDSSNKIVESDETNNNMTVSVSVTAPFPPPTSPPSRGGGGGGGSATVHPSIRGTLTSLDGVTKFAESSMFGVIRYFEYDKKQFYTAEPELFGIIGVSGGLPIKPDLVSQINRVSPTPVKDISEEEVYKISSEIIRQKFPSASTALIARGDLGSDSLAAVSYAQMLGIPILLTAPDSIPKETQEALNLLFTKNVIVIGGEEAVSEQVYLNLPATMRIGGRDRYETAVLLAEKIIEKRGSAVDTVIITDGENINPYSLLFIIKYNAPVVYTKGSNIPDVTKDFLKKHEFKKVMLIGTSASSSEIEKLMGI